MFTGLITEVGVIRSVKREGGGFRVGVSAPRTSRGLAVGGSVAVDGVCLTAVRAGRGAFSVQVVAETAAKSTFDAPRSGRRVNLERPLRPGDELGGHFLQGHVDSTAQVLTIARAGTDVRLEVELPRLLKGLLVPKGSIAVNGVSLTLVEVTPRRFSVALIPHTLRETNLGDLQPGRRVNLEADILAKYVRAAIQNQDAPRRRS